MIAMSDQAVTVTGRPKTNPVWNYFSYDEMLKKANVRLQKIR